MVKNMNCENEIFYFSSNDEELGRLSAGKKANYACEKPMHLDAGHREACIMVHQTHYN
jgi:hypothetical protein